MSPKIVTIGGGTGAPSIIKSLILAGFSNIQAISTAMDSGGKTGTIRTDERDRVIAISDLFRNLLALIPPTGINSPQIQAFTDLVNYTDGRNRNLGYTLYYALLEKYQNDFLQTQAHLEQLLNINFLGTAIPVTLESANLGFTTQTGSTHWGEHELDRLSMSTDMVTDFYLDHPIKATKQAQIAIQNANYLIFCPGSFYGSVLANLLPEGIISALNSSKAKKILITNLVSDRNQTHQIDLANYLKLFDQYSHQNNLIDIVICPHLSRRQFEAKYPRSARNYATEHSHFLGWSNSEIKKLKKSDLSFLAADIFTITTRHRLRHDPTKLAHIFETLIQ